MQRALHPAMDMAQTTEIASTLRVLGKIHRALGNREEARERYKAALEMERACVRTNDTTTARTLGIARALVALAKLTDNPAKKLRCAVDAYETFVTVLSPIEPFHPLTLRAAESALRAHRAAESPKDVVARFATKIHRRLVVGSSCSNQSKETIESALLQWKNIFDT